MLMASGEDFVESVKSLVKKIRLNTEEHLTL